MTEKPEGQDQMSVRHARMKKRNRLMGLSLFAFVIILAVVSYYRVGALMP